MTWHDRARSAVSAAPWLIIAWLTIIALQALAGDAQPRAAPVALAPTAVPAPPRTAALAVTDAELVLGPAAAGFDTSAFVAAQGGVLASYGEMMGGVQRPAAEIVQAVAEDHSVSPRVLLAMLQLASGVVDGGEPGAMSAPLGVEVANAQGSGLRLALAWLASTLNAAYYGKGQSGAAAVTLADGRAWTAPAAAGAGHVAVAAALAELDGSSDLTARLAEFAALYAHWFGPLPTERAAAPPAMFPPLLLPWVEGETWHFTGGPHEAWGRGTPLGAIDFAPPSPNGCRVAQELAVASAPGVVAVSRDGYVLLDLDGDGFVGTGPVLQYLHMADLERAPVGTAVQAGDPIGHPSCEGGFATGSHVHFARRLDGEWLPAVGGPAPLALSGWRFERGQQPYEGHMAHQTFGERSALKRRNGDATGVRSDNGPSRRAELATAWSAMMASGERPGAAESMAPEVAVAALPGALGDGSGDGAPPASVAAPAAAAADPAHAEPSPGAAPQLAALAAPPDASGGIDSAPHTDVSSTLVVRLQLAGRDRHDASFVLAVAGADGAVVPLVGHTDALGVSIPLTLPPALRGTYDLVLRVPGFREAHALGVPLGGGPMDVDLTAGGVVALQPGDLDADGDIDLGDVAAWAAAARRGLREADLDADGRAGPSDLWRVVASMASRR